MTLGICIFDDYERLSLTMLICFNLHCDVGIKVMVTSVYHDWGIYWGTIMYITTYYQPNISHCNTWCSNSLLHAIYSILFYNILYIIHIYLIFTITYNRFNCLVIPWLMKGKSMFRLLTMESNLTNTFDINKSLNKVTKYPVKEVE